MSRRCEVDLAVEGELEMEGILVELKIRVYIYREVLYYSRVLKSRIYVPFSKFYASPLILESMLSSYNFKVR